MGHAIANKSNNVIGIAALAAMLGAIAALLFTPKSGQEMRSELKDRAQRTKDMTKDKVDTVKSKMDRAKSKTKDTIADTADKLSDSNALDEYNRL